MCDEVKHCPAYIPAVPSIVILNSNGTNISVVFSIESGALFKKYILADL